MTLHPYAMPPARSALLSRMEGNLIVLFSVLEAAKFLRDEGTVAGEFLHDSAQQLFSVTEGMLAEAKRVIGVQR
jgi:hypothetical protein